MSAFAATPVEKCLRAHPGALPAPVPAPDFARHQRKCGVCHHPDREAIEEPFVCWHSPSSIQEFFDCQIGPLCIARPAPPASMSCAAATRAASSICSSSTRRPISAEFGGAHLRAAEQRRKSMRITGELRQLGNADARPRAGVLHAEPSRPSRARKEADDSR